MRVGVCASVSMQARDLISVVINARNAARPSLSATGLQCIVEKAFKMLLSPLLPPHELRL